MNHFLALCLSCVFICSGCVSTYFKTPNDLYRETATVYLNDGTEKDGQLTVQLETASSVTLFNKEKKQTENIPIKTINYYKIKDNYYFLKELDVELNGVYHFLFVKRLTDENSKMQLYELHQRYKTTETGEDRKLYFLSLPTSGKYEAISIYSKQLTHQFEYNMSAIVKDCASLAEKIKAKTKGYYIPSAPSMVFPESKRIEVYKRIIEEYNNCK
ncbi:MAG TPA: hypothetical protein VGQ53_10140 [Chitinophagaceae bacterium]|jgi:hypothetical protein|nr:hypothetical protein [Chitinophagaceae bacterium]